MTFSTFVIGSRRELAERSAFTLPKGRKIPGLSEEQIRTAERHGLIGSEFVAYKEIPGRPLVLSVWRPRKRGQTRLYSLLDLVVVRVMAWLLADAWSMQTVASTLRVWAGREMIRVSLRTDPTAEVMIMARSDPRDVPSGMVCRANYAARIAREFKSVRVFRYPLRHVGIGGGSLPRQQKDRELLPAREVWMHGKLRPVEEVVTVAREARP